MLIGLQLQHKTSLKIPTTIFQWAMGQFLAIAFKLKWWIEKMRGKVTTKDWLDKSDNLKVSKAVL